VTPSIAKENPIIRIPSLAKRSHFQAAPIPYEKGFRRSEFQLAEY
jgi:hypothetical protein